MPGSDSGLKHARVSELLLVQTFNGWDRKLKFVSATVSSCRHGEGRGNKVDFAASLPHACSLKRRDFKTPSVKNFKSISINTSFLKQVSHSETRQFNYRDPKLR